MKYDLIRFCLCLIFLLPLATTQAEFAEVIFQHPENDDNELWRTETWDGRNAHRIFKHTETIETMAVQKDGPYIVIVAFTPTPERRWTFDAYLIDRTRPYAKARNLTWHRYDEIKTVDISHKGDVVFINTQSRREPAAVYGIYLIPRAELENEFRKATLLRKGDTFSRVRWAPDGIHIAYNTWAGDIYLYNTVHGGSKFVTQDGFHPAFSPDGDRLAFVHRFVGEGAAISIISLETKRRLKTLALGAHSSFSDLKWAPDGQSIIYTVKGNGTDNLYHNYVAPLDGGEHEEIMKVDGEGPRLLDWTNVAYAVEPANRLTTLWGKLKQQDLK